MTAQELADEICALAIGIDRELTFEGNPMSAEANQLRQLAHRLSGQVTSMTQTLDRLINLTRQGPVAESDDDEPPFEVREYQPE